MTQKGAQGDLQRHLIHQERKSLQLSHPFGWCKDYGIDSTNCHGSLLEHKQAGMLLKMAPWPAQLTTASSFAGEPKVRHLCVLLLLLAPVCGEGQVDRFREHNSGDCRP